MSDTLLLKLNLTRETPLPLRFDIWVDPARGIWCVGPPAAETSTALVLQQVRPQEFIEGKGSPV